MNEYGLRTLAELDMRSIVPMVDENPHLDGEVLAEKIVADLNEGQRWLLACREISREVTRLRRGRARAAEVSATRTTRQERAALTVTNLAEGMAALESQLREKLLLDLSGEAGATLLRSDFAPGDGALVTWGEATVAQHEQRALMLVGTASGTIESIQRHQAAIRLLEESGTSCLADYTRGVSA